jgi:hypothetical protein
MPENEGKSVLHAGKRGAHEFINVLVEYLLPIATFFTGLFTGVATWGGPNVVWNALNNPASGGKLHGYAGLVDLALFGGVFGSVGYGFWQLGHHDGLAMKALGRGFGGYFFGVAVGYIVFGIAPSSTPDGLIDELVYGLNGMGA